MKTRPWPLVLLAIFQIFSPVGTVLFNAWALGVKPEYVLSWILQKPPIQIFESLLLMPIAGLAIYQMKRWSYVVFFMAMAWSLGANLRNWNIASEAYPIGWILVIYGLQLGLAVYFIIPSVRRTYMDPRVRWWEAKRRFLLHVPVGLGMNGQETQGMIQNVSEGGVFLQSSQSFETHQKLNIRFSVSTVEFTVPGEVMYRVPQPSGGFAYGVKFLHSDESLERFSRMARGLELIGVPDRDQDAHKPWYVGMRDWFVGLIKTGKGLVPDVKGKG